VRHAVGIDRQPDTVSLGGQCLRKPIAAAVGRIVDFVRDVVEQVIVTIFIHGEIVKCRIFLDESLHDPTFVLADAIEDIVGGEFLEHDMRLAGRSQGDQNVCVIFVEVLAAGRDVFKMPGAVGMISQAILRIDIVDIGQEDVAVAIQRLRNGPADLGAVCH